ncbi:MAG: hypothetical protein ACTSXT_01380 [Candidatus Helarchaeota archaeon]
MKEIYLDWLELKNNIFNKNFPKYYQKIYNGYKVFSTDNIVIWICNIISEEEKLDFESNYKSKCNNCIYDESGKLFVRAESRPINCTTCFTTCGDILGNNPQIGAGNRLEWDASNEDDFNVISGTGFKKKEITIQFCDSIWIKEGTIYYMNCLKNSTLDIEILCPPESYYMYLGQLQQNTTGDWLVVDHYLLKHPLQGSVPMGDELNTESCSQELPPYLKYKITITVPEDDFVSYGYIEIELYRKRTVII